LCYSSRCCRYSFDPNCNIWQQAGSNWLATETIDGTSDGFKAPYMFQEGGAQEDIIVWVDEGQRRVRFVFLEDITFKSIKLWRYKMDLNTLKNTTTATDGGYQAMHYYMINHPSGVASRQRTDSFDVFVSQPHYLNGDVNFFNSEMNPANPPFNPNPTLHDTYIDVEPLTGRVFAGRKRLQVGLYLSQIRQVSGAFGGIYAPIVANYPGNSGLTVDNCYSAAGVTSSTPPCTYAGGPSGGKNLYWPIAWATEGQDISDSDASAFVSAVYGTRQTFFITQIVLVIVGGVMFFTFLILCVKARQATTSL